ncbi:MAG: InlB B-repeat-containing protein [Bacteroidota bacterium]|nr:InlB B-repeat-containing protein [Bacteroidota bacterium]
MKKIISFLALVLLIIACKKDATPAPQPAGNQFSISYNGNGNTGGSVPVDGNAYNNGVSAIILGNSGNLIKTSSSFAGWNTAADGSGTDYFPPSSIIINNSNVTLYAKWIAGTFYTVTYDGNGNTAGSAPVDNTAYATAAQVTVKNNTGGLNKNGYSFINWNTSPSGNSQSYSPGSSLSIFNNITLYAIYNTPSTSGSYFGFNASGQLKSKASLTSSWASEDLNNTFGSSSVVAVAWNGSKYIGFNASGQIKSKSSLTASWVSEDLNNTFGSSSVVAVVYK